MSSILISVTGWAGPTIGKRPWLGGSEDDEVVLLVLVIPTPSKIVAQENSPHNVNEVLIPTAKVSDGKASLEGGRTSGDAPHDVVDVLVEEHVQEGQEGAVVSFMIPFVLRHCCHSSCDHQPRLAHGLSLAPADSAASSSGGGVSSALSLEAAMRSLIALWSM